MPHGDDVSFAHEEVGFAERDTSVHELRGSHHNEETSLVLFKLGPLVGLAGVLDRKRMQVELGLHLAEHSALGSCNPIQTTWRGRRAQSPASARPTFATRRPST